MGIISCTQCSLDFVASILQSLIILFAEKIKSYLDQYIYVGIVFLDFNEAFDTAELTIKYY